MPHHYGWKPEKESAPVVRMLIIIAVIVVIVGVAFALFSH